MPKMFDIKDFLTNYVVVVYSPTYDRTELEVDEIYHCEDYSNVTDLVDEWQTDDNVKAYVVYKVETAYNKRSVFVPKGDLVQ